jgi:hypothetical protein
LMLSFQPWALSPFHARVNISCLVSMGSVCDRPDLVSVTCGVAVG